VQGARGSAAALEDRVVGGGPGMQLSLRKKGLCCVRICGRSIGTDEAAVGMWRVIWLEKTRWNAETAI
jgi:hypothetical protein